MSTTDDARMAAIRRMAAALAARRSRSTHADTIIYLLAEVDRLTRDLAAVTDERDEIKRWRDIKTTEEIARLRKLGGDIAYACSEVSQRYGALRAAHTWTVATPVTMPPVGSGPWLVEIPHSPRFVVCTVLQGYGQIIGPPLGKGVRGIQLIDDLIDPQPKWHGNGNQYNIDGTRFAAVPDEPAKEATL